MPEQKSKDGTRQNSGSKTSGTSRSNISTKKPESNEQSHSHEYQAGYTDPSAGSNKSGRTDVERESTAGVP